jgi:glyoxylase-like metal-dependent hydrolase (beta-lactamase superfamily II)
MLKRMTRSAAGAILLLAGAQASAHDVMTLDQFAAAIGWDFESAEIRTEKVGDNLYVLFGVGGNIAVSVGDDGVLVVDDQFPRMMDRIKAAIAELGGAEIDFAINTHWHFDHADGNLTLGPEGTWIVAQANARAMNLDDHVINLVSMQIGQAAYPAAALPDLTFDDRMQFHFNGEKIDLVHFGPAHTTGDTGVIFRGSNAVHLGDVFNGLYPFIDADNGGGINGLISFCEAVLAEIDTDTKVIPGHGEVSTYADLQAYIAMLSTIRDRIVAMIEDGMGLEEIIAAGPTGEFDERYGDPATVIDRAYHSLVRDAAGD